MNVNSFHLMCERTGKTICHCEQYEKASEIRDDFQRNAEILRIFEKRFPNTFVNGENDMEIEYEVFPKVEMSISRKGGVPVQPVQQKQKQPVHQQNKSLKKQTKKTVTNNLQKKVVIGAVPHLPQNQPKQMILPQNQQNHVTQQVMMNNKQQTNVVRHVVNPQKEVEKHLSPRIGGFDMNVPPPPPPPLPPIIVPKNSNIGINAGINRVVTQLHNNVNTINLPL